MCRVPEDGYYMFTLVLREVGDVHAAGTILINGVEVLCRAEQGASSWQTGTCTVRLAKLQLSTTFQSILVRLGQICDSSRCNHKCRGGGGGGGSWGKSVRQIACKVIALIQVFYPPQGTVIFSQTSVILSTIGLMSTRLLIILVASQSVRYRIFWLQMKFNHFFWLKYW